MNNPKDIKKRIASLHKAIAEYRTEYHLHDTDIVAPEVLDSLKRELADLEAQIGFDGVSPTNTVAGGVLPGFKKIKHAVRQWSFQDAFTKEDMTTWHERLIRELGHAPAYVAELKIDGFKIILTYEKGVLISAATRGDGGVGEDVTENIKTIPEIPHVLQKPISFTVEGEIWMGEKELKRLNTERELRGEKLFANPRNVAAGTVRQLDPELVRQRELHAFFYDISLSSDSLPSSQWEELALIKSLGLPVNPHSKKVSTFSFLLTVFDT